MSWITQWMPDLTKEQERLFIIYYDMLTEWNQRVNLTAITGREEVAKKHFLDSLLAADLIPQGALCADVGTGAGFPGIPIKIMRPDIRLTLIDSLNKRVRFLNSVAEALGIEADCAHTRAEDAGRNKAYRGQFDIVLSRAVAPVNALLEYTVPLLKEGGVSLMYKGPQAGAELEAARNALRLLNADARVIPRDAPWGERRIIAAVKTGETNALYPRKAGMAEKKPL